MGTQKKFEFEYYERPTQPISRETRAAAEITGGGRIKLNRTATRELLPEGDYVRLAYDRDRASIGILVTEDPEPRVAVRVHRIAKGTEVSIAAKSFFDFFQIPLPTAGLKDLRVYQPNVEGDDRFVVIALGEDEKGTQ